MRNVVLSLAAFAVAFAVAARADDAEAKRVIEKATKAHGGAEVLGKLKDKSTVMKGKLTIAQLNDQECKLEGFAGGNKFKHVVELSINGMDITQTVVYDGKEMWIAINGKVVMEIKGKDLDPIKELIHAEQLTGQALFNDKDLTFSLIGESKVDDKPVVGVRVSKKGYKDVSMYFDKETGLLAKTEHRSMDFQSREEVAEERVLKDYKEVDGYKRPNRVIVNRDGKKFAELEFTEVKLVDKLDDNTFDKP